MFFIGFGSSKLKLEPCSFQRALQKKNRPQLKGKKAEFCEWYCVHTSSPPTVQYTVTPRTSGVSVTVRSAILRVLIWTLETQVGASLV